MSMGMAAPLGAGMFVDEKIGKIPMNLADMEQDTGVEPAFTAWEAVVLPMYESCKSIEVSLL